MQPPLPAAAVCGQLTAFLLFEWTVFGWLFPTLLLLPSPPEPPPPQPDPEPEEADERASSSSSTPQIVLPGSSSRPRRCSPERPEQGNTRLADTVAGAVEGWLQSLVQRELGDEALRFRRPAMGLALRWYVTLLVAWSASCCAAFLVVKVMGDEALV